MKPVQLGAHTRPITKVRINTDGDLCFTTGSDGKCMAWYTSNGERLGTYEGHKGAIFDVDVDANTTYLLTASSDCTFGVWEVCTGKIIRMVEPRAPDRCTAVRWAHKENRFLVCTIGGKTARCLIYHFDPQKFAAIPEGELGPAVVLPSTQGGDWQGHTAKISEALWGPENDIIFTASEDGQIRRWNSRTAQEEARVEFNPQRVGTGITSLGYSYDKALVVASGKDNTARIFETTTLRQLKVFTSDKPLNCACFHPRLQMVMVGGGQAARDVTTTTHGQGKFEVEFFHTQLEEKVGEIRTGHFSPINSLAISGDGSHFATGAEEGFVRLFKLDPKFESKFSTLERNLSSTIPS